MLPSDNVFLYLWGIYDFFYISFIWSLAVIDFTAFFRDGIKLEEFVYLCVLKVFNGWGFPTIAASVTSNTDLVNLLFVKNEFFFNNLNSFT